MQMNGIATLSGKLPNLNFSPHCFLFETGLIFRKQKIFSLTVSINRWNYAVRRTTITSACLCKTSRVENDRQLTRQTDSCGTLIRYCAGGDISDGSVGCLFVCLIRAHYESGLDGPCWMVVIVIVSDRNGPSRPSRGKKKVTYVSTVHIKPTAKFFLQVEPGETVATTKEGKSTKNNYAHTNFQNCSWKRTQKSAVV